MLRLRLAPATYVMPSSGRRRPPRASAPGGLECVLPVLLCACEWETEPACEPGTDWRAPPATECVRLWPCEPDPEADAEADP